MRDYGKSFLWSVLLHATLLLFLLINLSRSAHHYVLKKSEVTQKPIIQTTAISEEKINQEIERIQSMNRKKIAEDNRKRAALIEEAKQIQRKKQTEAMRLAKLKESVLRLKKKRALEKQKELERAKRLKALRAKERQKLNRERAKIEKLKQKRLQEEKQLEEAKKQQALKRKRQQAERELALKAQEEKRITGIIDRYKSLILSAISQNWIVPGNVDKSLSSKFEIKLSPTGQVLSVRLLRSSGDAVLDRSARMAIFKAQPLPVPNMPEVYALFKVISLTVRPEEAVT